MTRLVLKLGSSSIASGDGLALDVMADLVTQGRVRGVRVSAEY